MLLTRAAAKPIIRAMPTLVKDGCGPRPTRGRGPRLSHASVALSGLWRSHNPGEARPADRPAAPTCPGQACMAGGRTERDSRVRPAMRVAGAPGPEIGGHARQACGPERPLTVLSLQRPAGRWRHGAVCGIKI